MSSPDVLQSQFEQNLNFGHDAPEHLLGVNERDEMLVAVTAFLGPIGAVAAPEVTAPFRPVLETRRLATAPEVASTIEFIPAIETEVPAWRDARRDTGAAAIMFAWQRPDITEYEHEDLALAA